MMFLFRIQVQDTKCQPTPMKGNSDRSPADGGSTTVDSIEVIQDLVFEFHLIVVLIIILNE